MAAAPGDDDILEALWEMRILMTNQLARKTGRSGPVIRRRIRKHLIPEGLVAVHDGGGSSEQHAYSLTKSGFEVMAARAGVDPAKAPFSSRPPSGPGSPFFRHTCLTNTIWIEFDRACSQPESPVELVRAVPEWTMAEDPKLRRPKRPWERFIISEQLGDIEDPDRFHVVRPDALFLLAPRHEKRLRVAAYLEADRATVSVTTVITEKLVGYWHIFLHRSFERWGALAMRVCFVIGSARTDRRLESLRIALADFKRKYKPRHERFRQARLEAASPEIRPTLERRLPTIDSFIGCFRLCRREDFADDDIVSASVWMNADGERVPFFRGEPAAESGEARHDATGATP